MKRTTVGLIAGLMLGAPALAQETPTPVDGEERPSTPPPQPLSPPGQAPRNSPISEPDSEGQDSQEAPSEGTGGSGQQPVPPPPPQGTGGAGQQPAPEPDTESPRGETKELTARVLGASPGILYVEGKEGAAIPLRVTHATRVAGRRVPREQSIDSFLKKELAPGKSVRVTFDVRTHEDGKLENVVSTLDTP